MLMDIIYTWILRKYAKFHGQPWYWCREQDNQWYNICVIIIFSWKYHLGLHFYRIFIFKNYPMILYETLGTPW